ncbi:MAG: GNAT family N-acetyltransferase [Candidatus Marinimicrobia bacterium]|nr:GNAT family N-acetyltransferase [Candidatus Neomarinimicrobiota bacterium]
MNITFKSFRHDSPLYDESIVLRNRILIEAVGRHEDCRDFDFPEKDIYISAFDGNALIGTAIITPLDDNTVQMRQMAVDEIYQGQGVGKAIADEFERVALKNGYSKVILHARESAVHFYKAVGYELRDDKFYEIEIPHYEMRKDLTQSEQSSQLKNSAKDKSSQRRAFTKNTGLCSRVIPPVPINIGKKTSL